MSWSDFFRFSWMSSNYFLLAGLSDAFLERDFFSYLKDYPTRLSFEFEIVIGFAIFSGEGSF